MCVCCADGLEQGNVLLNMQADHAADLAQLNTAVHGQQLQRDHSSVAKQLQFAALGYGSTTAPDSASKVSCKKAVFLYVRASGLELTFRYWKGLANQQQ